MKLIRQLLQRRAQWERLYPKWYIDRHFTLYEGELEELLKMAKSRACPKAPRKIKDGL